MVTSVAAALCVLATAVTAGCSGPPQSAHTTVARSAAASRSAAAAAARRAARHAPPSYYVALGDSLAQGVQPDMTGASLPTSAGYADRLYASLRPGHPNLRLVKLGCSGETSFTMIHGGVCRYPAGSQLSQAVRVLRAHHRHLTLITIDIGANDPNSCFIDAPLSKLPGCMSSRVGLTVGDLYTILSRLRAAGGRRVRIIGMNYYVPELSGWFHGKLGQEIAVLVERLVHGYNNLLGHVYRHFRVRVADVFSAFHSADFTGRMTLDGARLPRNVGTLCQLTWACARPPLGPDEHANSLGYGVMAQAFLLADRARRR
jgi:lysophospholipase L1-like esterase